MRTQTICLALAIVLLRPCATAQWVRTGELYGGTIRSLCVSDTNLYAGADTGGVFLSTNNGTSWTAVNAGLPLNAGVYALAVSGTNLFAGIWDIDSALYRSTNSGASWTSVGGNLGLGVLALAVMDTDLFVGTRRGGVYRSTNNGTSWTHTSDGVNVSDLGVRSFAVIDTNLFAGGGYGGVFLSTNRGMGWTQVITGMPPYRQNGVACLAVIGTNLFAGTTSGVFLSTNNGTNWTSIDTGLTGTAYAFAVSGTNPFAGTAISSVFLTTDCGTRWTDVSSGLENSLVNTFVVSGTYLFAGTSKGHVWRRSLSEMIPMAPASPTLSSPLNGATSVSTVPTLVWMRPPGAISYWLEVATDGSFASGVVFSDSTLTDTSRVVNGLLNATEYYWRVARKNVDGTGPWSAVWRFTTIGQLPEQISLVAPADKQVIAGDTVRFIWRWGQPSVVRHWFELALDSTFSYKFLDSTISDSTYVVRGLLKGATFWWRVKAYNAAGWGAFREVRKFTVNLTSVDSPAGTPTEFSLSQNYPNPFNPSTTIGFGISGPGSSWVKLAVYDMLGREVAVLVNDRREAGYHEVRFDGSGLSSGVYFYRIQVRPLDFPLSGIPLTAGFGKSGTAVGVDSKSGAGVFVQTRRLLLVR